MTQLLDVAMRRELLARWCTLAEQRLQHLTDLFESGRWRRYYGERAFLENIKEAKKAVETWRALSGQPPVARQDETPVMVHPEREASVLVEHEPRVLVEREPEVLWRPSAPPVEMDFTAAETVVEEEVASSLDVDLDALEKALIGPAPITDLATMEQRYPLLRNAL